METIIGMLSLVLTNNLVLSFVKYLAVSSTNRRWLRAMLFAVSAIGVIAASAVNGTPIDFNQLTEWARFIVETIVLAVGSHFSYRAIKKA